MTAEEILSAVRALPAEQRVELGHAILDEAAADQPAPVSDALRAELERRIAHARAHPETLVPWEVVYARTMARLKK